MDESHIIILIVVLVVAFMFFQSNNNQPQTVVVHKDKHHPVVVRPYAGGNFARWRPPRHPHGPFKVYKKFHRPW